MSKLKKLIEQYSYQNEGVYTLLDIRKLCVEYAKVCLEKAANEACLRCQGVTTLEEWKEDTFTGTDGFQDIYIDVSKQSITDIELP